MKKIFWTGLAAGIAMLIINALLTPLFGVVFPALQDAYMNPVFRPWIDPVMMLFFLYPIVLGFPLAYVWVQTKGLFKSTPLKNGFDFGLIYLFVVSIPVFFINFSTFNLPFSMIMSWVIMGVINGFVAGLVLAKLNK